MNYGSKYIRIITKKKDNLIIEPYKNYNIKLITKYLQVK